MSTESATASGQTELIERIRRGDDVAFGELFQVHETAVRRLARGLTSNSTDAEDVVAETFFRVFQTVRRGNGPNENVRAYLFTVARRVAAEWQAARRDIPVPDEELTARAGTGGDWQSRTTEASLITRAFTSLPERWRTVLWRTEVEGVQPAVLAPHLGLSANATAALARRARIGLRAAYLQAHLAVSGRPPGCLSVLRKLGGYTAGTVTGTEARKIRHHLGACSTCRSTQDELRRVCWTLRAYATAVVVSVPLSGFALTVSGAGLGAGAGAAAGASTSATATGIAAGGAGAGAAVAAGGGKFGLTFLSTAAVVGMVGTPGFDGGDYFGVSPVPTASVIATSSGEQEGADRKSAATTGRQILGAVGEPTSEPDPIAMAAERSTEPLSGLLTTTEFVLPARSDGHPPVVGHDAGPSSADGPGVPDSKSPSRGGTGQERAEPDPTPPPQLDSEVFEPPGPPTSLPNGGSHPPAARSESAAAGQRPGG